MQLRAAIGSLPPIGSTFQMEEVMAPMSHFFTNVKNDCLQMADATEGKIMYLLGLMAVDCTEPYHEE